MNARALPFALCCLVFAAPCAADDGGPVSRAAMERGMLSYYGGEYASACLGMALGVTSVGVGGALVTRDGDFERGLGWPLLSLGAIESVGG